jgi:dolichol-phosphate mannosyltransferase
LLRAGLRVQEVPIVFADRHAGESKMSRAVFAEAVWKVPQLRWRALAGKL